MANRSPFRLVAADAVQQIQHRVLRVLRVSRAACRPASCGAVPTVFESYSTISSWPCGIPSRLALNPAGRIGERRLVVGPQVDGPAESTRTAGPRRGGASAGRAAAAGGAAGAWCGRQTSGTSGAQTP